jgi:hypothetical protein
MSNRQDIINTLRARGCNLFPRLPSGERIGLKISSVDALKITRGSTRTMGIVTDELNWQTLPHTRCGLQLAPLQMRRHSNRGAR